MTPTLQAEKIFSFCDFDFTSQLKNETLATLHLTFQFVNNVMPVDVFIERALLSFGTRLISCELRAFFFVSISDEKLLVFRVH